MRAPICLILLTIPTIFLASCDDRAAPIAAVGSVLSEPTPESRKAKIIQQVAAHCPRPLSADEAEWAAQFVEENRSKGAVWIAGKLWRMNAETRLCRGLK